MGVEFDQLPPSARVWIYQASRALTAAELAEAQPLLARFATEWTSHGQALRAAAEFRHGQFLVIGLDEEIAGASGCSIDASVRFVRELEQRFGVGLLEKTTLAFWQNEQVMLLPHTNLRPAIAAGQVQPELCYFDNTLTNKGDFAAKWPAPAEQTWLARYFKSKEKKGVDENAS